MSQKIMISSDIISERLVCVHSWSTSALLVVCLAVVLDHETEYYGLHILVFSWVFFRLTVTFSFFNRLWVPFVERLEVDSISFHFNSFERVKSSVTVNAALVGDLIAIHASVSSR
jgi:hypothetical protein